MELSPYVEGLRRELTVLTRFAPRDVAETASMLAEALDSSVRLTLLDVLAAAAAEITARLDDTAIDVRLSGGDPDFVVTAVPAATAEAPGGAARPADGGEAGDDSGTARITLRLAEGLKSRIEARAAADGVSVNAWIAQVAARALDDQRGPAAGRRSGIGQRITGYARS